MPHGSVVRRPHGGHVDLLYEQAGDVKGHLDGKALRPLIFFAPQHLPAPFADVPIFVVK